MIVADVLFYFLIIVGLYVAFISYWVAAEALFPRFVERSRSRYEGKPVTTTLIGFFVALPIGGAGLLAVTRMGHPAMQIGGLAIIFLLVVLGLLGSAGLCRQIGRGLASPKDEAQPWRRVLRGGAILGLTFVLPFIGWFAIMPLTFISGLGAAVRAIYAGRRERARSVSATVATPPPISPTPVFSP